MEHHQLHARARLTVQTTSAGSTAMDFRLAALDRTTAVDRSYFANVCFLGDSLTQGMQIYSSGLPEASFCAYRGAGPSVVVNGTTCKRSDGGTEVPMEVLTARQPPVLYILLGTNVLNRDGDYSSFLTYYRLMLDMISQALPNTQIYVQSITPVRPEVRSSHPGLYKERLCEINNELAAIALEKKLRFPQPVGSPCRRQRRPESRVRAPDGIHIKPEATPPGWNISPPTPWANRRLKLNTHIEKPPFRHQTGRTGFVIQTGTGNAASEQPRDLAFGIHVDIDGGGLLGAGRAWS